MTSTVRAAGLDVGLSAALAPWRSANAVHDPAKVLLDLAITLALGGDTCSDLAVVRAEPAVFGPVASDPTLSRTIARLAADVDRVLPAIDRARATARARVWGAAGTHALDHGADARHPVVVDVDATLVTSHREGECQADVQEAPRNTATRRGVANVARVRSDSHREQSLAGPCGGQARDHTSVTGARRSRCVGGCSAPTGPSSGPQSNSRGTGRTRPRSRGGVACPRRLLHRRPSRSLRGHAV